MPEGFETDNDLGIDMEPLVAACVFKESGFFEKFAPVLLPEMFMNPLAQAAITFLRDYYAKYKSVPSNTVFQDVVRRSHHADPGGVVDYVDTLPDPTDAAYVVERVLRWAKWRSVDSVLSDEAARLDPREFSRQIEKASRTGDDLLLDHARLDVDEEDEEILGEPIPTPWEWLNQKLHGGPVRGDFFVPMTVINGGKTTIMTNVFMRAVALGYHAIYFTAEDGEKKMKRRMLQYINGWTIDQILADIAKARQRRDQFLEQCGGVAHIKNIKSRRTSVDDLIAFIRSIEDSTGRKVDLVCTDYPDRLRAQGRYTEPRHGLREIYEDCKYLARECDVVHWGASQVNTKTKMGKDIVGMEDGTESTGKFESADGVLGFGQTMEDVKRGTMVMYTSKLRDATKQEVTNLIADFETQRIYEPGDEMMMRRHHKGTR